ncbi:DNA-directed RNA polymerase III 25 kd polypeptide [Saccharata proteae CBS 121410]|uniref:DNA-directed RNA polymerase subunit n=1 Tax=Saccharata proteae CBS 121410 TaxID=1314787 RepID=A0A9P4HTF4_9PEZI|nr:DNA-directed RNA polymerase III 25 kd polypeptide [Saccharata proteae CBS 121410]
MFMTTTISDLIQIKPEEFEKSSAEALKDAIHTKYANKVIQEVGLCICLRDILKSSEGLIGHGTGIVNVNVVFRLVVFRPFKGEVIEGKISAADHTGIHVQVDFFDEIFVPGPVNLFEGTKYVPAESVWVWTTENGDELFFDLEETVRFRVEAEFWHDQSPQAPQTEDTQTERTSPYKIIASMQQAGLGPTLWWEEVE